MGYRTLYSLELVIPNTAKYQYEDVLSDLRSTNDSAERALEEDGRTAEECKWYDHKEDMKEFSRKYPETVFVLKGEGEEASDLWIRYFYNGKMQDAPAKIFYDEFDPAKLS